MWLNIAIIDMYKFKTSFAALRSDVPSAFSTMVKTKRSRAQFYSEDRIVERKLNRSGSIEPRIERNESNNILYDHEPIFALRSNRPSAIALAIFFFWMSANAIRLSDRRKKIDWWSNICWSRVKLHEWY